MIHELKTMPEYFAEVISGRKTFEVRKFDRPFHENDLLALNEYDTKRKCYTGNSCLVYIDYILNDQKYCRAGYVIMSIKPCMIRRATTPFDRCQLTEDYRVPYATREPEEDVDE